MTGIDISNWQVNLNLIEYENDFEFAIVKLTDGSDYIDKEAQKFISDLIKMDKAIGAYHFSRIDGYKEEKYAMQEADLFCDRFMELSLIDRAIPFLDLELHTGNKVAKLVEIWMDRVYHRLGIMPMLYCPIAWYLEYYNGKYDYWYPHWRQNDRVSIPNTWEYVNKNFYKIMDTDCKIVQVTSRGFFDNYYLAIDIDYTPMTKEEWSNMAKGIENTKPKDEIVSQDMLWCAENGIFKGYNDGSYREDEPLTRGQCAIVLRRFYNFLKEDITYYDSDTTKSLQSSNTPPNSVCLYDK